MYLPPFVLFNYDPSSVEFISIKNITLQSLPFLILLVVSIIAWLIFGIYYKRSNRSVNYWCNRHVLNSVWLFLSISISLSFLLFTIVSPIYLLHLGSSVTSIIQETNKLINDHKNEVVGVSNSVCNLKSFNQRESELIQSVYNATRSNVDLFVPISNEIRSKFNPLYITDELQQSESYLSFFSNVGCQLYNVLTTIDDIDIKDDLLIYSYLTTTYMSINVYTSVFTILCFAIFVSYCLFSYPFFEQCLCRPKQKDLLKRWDTYLYRTGFTMIFFFLLLGIILPLITASNIVCERIDPIFVNDIKPTLEKICAKDSDLNVQVDIAGLLDIDLKQSLNYTLLEGYLSQPDVATSTSGINCRNNYEDFKVYIKNQFVHVDNSIDNSLHMNCDSLGNLIIDLEDDLCTQLPLYLVIVFCFTLVGVYLMICIISYILLYGNDPNSIDKVFYNEYEVRYINQEEGDIELTLE